MGICGSKPKPANYFDKALIEAVKSIPVTDRFFKGTTDTDRLVALAQFQEETFCEGQRVLTEGDAVDDTSRLYVLCTGSMDVCVEGRAEPVGRIDPGEVFGHLAVLFGTFRSASVVASTTCVAWSCSRESSVLLIRRLPFAENLCFLRNLDILRGYSDQALEEIVDKVREVTVTAGGVVVRAGEAGDSMFAIKRGLLDISRDGKTVGILYGGSTFGMWSLLSGAPRSATIIARAYTVVLEIGSWLMTSDADPLFSYAMNREAVLAVEYGAGVLAGLDPDERTVALDNLEVAVYGEGELVCEAGETHTLYVVRHGEVDRPKGTQSGFAYFGSVRGEIVARAVRAVAAGTKIIKVHADAGARPGVMARQELPPDMFEWMQPLGKGGFATVDLVREISNPDRFYALKTPNKSTHATNLALAKELTVMAVVDSPFCVRLEARIQGQPRIPIREGADVEWLALPISLLLEYVPGGTLHGLLERCHRLDESDAMFYMGCVLLGLEAIHGAGVVYRDVKPENLMIDADGYLKIGDFGFAKRTNGERCYSLVGTEHYSAPEIPAHTGTTATADFWSAGILLFEMLTGRTPFESAGGTAFHTYRRAAAGRFTVPDYVSEPCEALLRALLQPDPPRRLGTGGNAEITCHEWFGSCGFDWDALRRREMRAPNLLGPPDRFDASPAR